MEAVSDDALLFTGHKLKRDKKAKLLSYLEYSDDEVKELLEAATKIRTQPNLAPLIQLALYSGMRINEICKLEVTDVENGIINVEDSKTDAGIRAFPVHPKLKNLIEQLKKDSKDGYLLSGLSSKNKYKNRADAIGKAFGRMKTTLDYGKRYAFHSFRSTVATKLEQAGIAEGIAADILGHEKKTMNYGLYSGGSSMGQKEKAIKSLKYT